MAEETSISAMLKHCDSIELHQFILDYANKNSEFRKAFYDRFNPVKKITGNKKSYADQVRVAFLNNSLRSGNRYRKWDDYGFDAEDVAADMEDLLDKAGFFMEAGNVDEAVLICQALIETIPEAWYPDFDYEGDVQVMYDGAIDLLQEMMEQQLLPVEQKEELFKWYSLEYQKEKHEYVGLNTAIEALEMYFSDTPEMLRSNLKNLEARIKNKDGGYKQEHAAISKILLLQKAGLNDEAEKAITEYIRFENVRMLRLKKLLKAKQYDAAIKLITEGIKIAVAEKHPGTVSSWKKELLSIYKLQKNTEKILSTAEELFYNDSGDSREHYKELKKYTPEKDWPATLERLLSKMDTGYFGFNSLKADILIEHKMWERLFALCVKAGVEQVEAHEKYLRPMYNDKILAAYQKYAEQQALLTDRHAYLNVARILKKMKKFEGGTPIVVRLLAKYRELYKRRKNMMEALKGV